MLVIARMGRGSMACMSYILSAFTLIFVIFGILLMYTGFSAFISFNQYSLVIHNKPDGTTIALMVFGLATFLIAFLGCCGAITGNDFMLRSFAFILALLFIIEVITVVGAFAFKDAIRETMETGLEESIKKYNSSQANSITTMIDDIQTRFECCGALGPQDWKNNTQFENGVDLPKSCCPQIPPQEQCSMNVTHNKAGCLDQISQELKNSLSYLGSLVITVIVLQIIGFIFACVLIGKRRAYAYV